MHKIIVTGSGPDIGKTVVSAILTTMLDGDYWKPIECGDREGSDTHVMSKLIDTTKHHIYSPAYSLKEPLSPHHSARLENIAIDPSCVLLPKTNRSLIIETAGGILTPLRTTFLNLYLFEPWQARWVVVSRHYLGSINHTLLTIEALKYRKIPILGIIFNGEPNPDSEEAILQNSGLPFLGRLLPEQTININIIQQYVEQWRTQLSAILQN